MKKTPHLFLIIFLLLIYRPVQVAAEEGMWLPQLLEKLNEKEMKNMGMKISAKDIYNIGGSSLKDAIVSFGGFCTGEVISSKGLLLTNHHCGFGSIQNHSTLEHNYIRDGFWAKNNGEEIPNQKLFVTFIIRIEEVTRQALNGVSSTMSESERQSRIDKNIEALKKTIKKEPFHELLIRGFFENNQYFLFVTESYHDIRLVGAPPSAIGNFGKDTDNWVWPRHTGDFSLFRIYAGKDNKPAAYSPDNIPYTPKRSLAISLDGLKENDFTMVFGFPGRTMEYLPASAVNQIITVNNPIKIAIREKALNVLDGFMRKDEQIKIQYASKYAGIQNSYKKWQGEMLGLTRTNALKKKEAYEKEFLKRIIASPALKVKYGTVLNELNEAYTELSSYGFARDYFNEIIGRIELFTVASQLHSLTTAYDKSGENGYKQKLIQVKEFLAGFYKDYNATVDQKLFEVLIEMYVMDQSKENISERLKEICLNSAGEFKDVAERFFKEDGITSQNSTNELLQKTPEDAVAGIKKNVAAGLYKDILETYQIQVQRKETEIQDRINKLQRIYMQAQLEAFKEKRFYPDANRTMRVTYGKVKGYDAAKDGVKYDFYTYLEGVMEKYIPGDYEFDVPEKLKALFKNKDYGPYANNGKMPVCFIATNHTTGGNSGSPALDANGNLVGLNFDRAWEGTMSDINYDPSICRNIMVDIRYILFIIDKYADAGHLVKEMKLVGLKK